jgi:RimJ/RimL family protein N-acetyltransferase
MTEAVGGMISWAKNEPEIHAIIADTEKQNTASFRILEKNGFVKIGETESLLKWRLQIKPIENEIKQ